MLGVYIHIPFCKKICTYCDFCKILYDTKYVDKYLDKLDSYTFTFKYEDDHYVLVETAKK